MDIQVLRNRVLIKPDPKKEQESGIVLARAYDPAPTKGTVVSVGPGRTVRGGVLVPPQVAVGDKVEFYPAAVDEVRIDDEDHLMMEETNIICVL